MKHTRFFQFLIIASLLSSLMGLPVQQAFAANVQPQLVELARQDPAQLVDVIVQKMAWTTGTEERVAALGGQVTKDLGIIHAFAAEMPAGAAVQLAQNSDVRWVSLDAPAVDSGGPDGTVNTTALLNVYDKAVGADKVWAQGYQGSSVTVAILDSGLNSHNDIKNDVVLKVKAASYPVTTADNYGHGTHVAGIVGGNGSGSSGKYIGIAPKVKILSVKVSDDQGMSLTSDVVAGLQWVYDNRTKYGIRVVNLSLNNTVQESYNVDPLDAAAEILWFNGIVVVVSAGNNGTSGLYPPANDPFVITVGAVEDKGTAALSDDVVAAFSAYGTTDSGSAKPDLVAPGRNIVSTLANSGSLLTTQHPSNKVSGASTYFRMSGTSMAAPIVSGAVALLLQDEPNLTPDQVKYRLMSTANKNWAGYSATTAGAGYLDIYAAVNDTSTGSANTGLMASQLLSTGSDPITWGSVGWNSVGWNSVGWNSVGWNSVGWNSVGWNSDYWGQ